MSIVGTTSAGLQQALAQIDEISERVIGLLDRTANVLDGLSSELKPIMDSLETVLSEHNADDIRRILRNLRVTTDDAGPRVASLLERLESVSEQLEGGLEGVPRATAEFTALVESVRQALGPEADAGRRTLRSSAHPTASSLGIRNRARMIKCSEALAIPRIFKAGMAVIPAFS